MKFFGAQLGDKSFDYTIEKVKSNDDDDDDDEKSHLKMKYCVKKVELTSN